MVSPKTTFAPPRKQPLSDPQIIEEQSGSKGRFVIKTPEGEAELTYSILSPNLRIADHTGVPKPF